MTDRTWNKWHAMLEREACREAVEAFLYRLQRDPAWLNITECRQGRSK